jgi:uncharacterized membrane protein HdeD (DUF308 family)
MMSDINAVMLGGVATASFIASLFFLRFWRQSHDRLFMWFAIAFAIDALMRLALGLSHVSNEQEPLFYLGRLISFCAIIIAIVQKNWPGKRGL